MMIVGPNSHSLTLLISYLEHFSYSHGKHGPLHAEPLQQQNLVSAVKHMYLMYSEFIF